MGRRKTKKSETSLINFKVEKNSKAKKWLDAQDNRTLSLNFLIGLASDQFGNKDLVNYALKLAKNNPELRLQENTQVNDVQAPKPSPAKKDQATISSATTETSSSTSNDQNVDNEELKPKRKRIIKSSKKEKKINYSDQLSKDSSIPKFSGLN